MKVGLSLSRCVRDIYEGNVKNSEVMVVIARTDFDPEDDHHWEGIWQGYHAGGGWSHPEWYGIDDEQGIRNICIDLKKTGRLHQPRQFGAHPPRMSYYWLEVGLTSDDIESNPSVKKAWEQFQIVAGLANKTTVKDNF